MRYSIVATNHCTPEAQAAIKTLKPGDALVLIREPENKFDKNAIAVYAGFHKVGYIPKGKNLALAALIDRTGAPLGVAIAQDGAFKATDKAIQAKFTASPNSAFTQVEVAE